MIRKKFICSLICMLSAIVLTACSSGGDSTDINNNSGSGGDGGGSSTPTGVASDKPTDWAVPVKQWNSSMMIMIESSDVPADVLSGDMMAAFIAGECRAVCQPVNDADGKIRFRLNVLATADDTNTSVPSVELRYWSAKEYRMWHTDGIKYIEEGMIGTSDAGYKPTWK